MERNWIDVDDRLPTDDKYILLSFSNFSVPVVGRYEEDKGGGAFYVGDDDTTCVSHDLFVNAWMSLPKQYQKSSMKKAKSYEEKIEIILRNRLEQNCNYNLEIKAVKTWLCCECYCGELDIDTFSRLINEVEKIAEKFLKNLK